jgi:pantetheine-phosphate adenylyltransferase
VGTKALYAGSFDPITLGHIDIIKRSSRMFDQVLIAVGHNPTKPGLFSLNERMDLIKQACKGIKNISFDSFSGLTAEFARQQKCTVLLRGLRDTQDFSFEMQMAHMNTHLESNIYTVFIPCHQQYSSISSSLVKEIASCLVQAGGKKTDKISHILTGLVTPAVAKALSLKCRK